MMTLVIPYSSKKKDLALKLALHITSTAYQLQLSQLAPVLPSTVDGLEEIIQSCEGGEENLEKMARCYTARQALRGEVYELPLPKAKWRSKLYRKALMDVIVEGRDPREVLNRLSTSISGDPDIREALRVLGGS